jgi:hypothetical protein
MKLRYVLKGLLVVCLLLVAVTVGYALPYPERWNETFVGLSRSEAWSVLGAPNANFAPKGWEGWNRNAIYGAWVLKVYYDESEKVKSVEKKFDWGLSYLSWNDDYYKKQLQRPN